MSHELYRWRWVALLALLIAEGMNLLDATIVQVAGPTIHADLGGSPVDIQWFSAAYTIAFAVLLLTGARLGDRLGRRRVFRLGVAGFLLTSAACAGATSPEMLIGLRVAQGAAAAVIIPQTIGLIRTMFDGPELSRALGTIGPVMGLAAVSGPVLGGVLTHADLGGSSWRAVFLVNVPLATAVLALASKLQENRAPRPPRVDAAGTVLAIGGTGAVVYPLIRAGSTDAPLWIWPMLVAGLLVLGVFVVQQRAAAQGGRHPLVEVSLFADRRFPAALLTSMLFFAAITGLTLAVVLHLQLGLGRGPLTAGLTLLPWSIGLAVASACSGGRLTERHPAGARYAGLAVLAAGVLIAIAGYRAGDPTSYPTAVLIALGLIGVGVGLFTPPFFTAALRPVAPQETGSAAGLLNAVQQLGGTLGVAILGGIYLSSARTGGPAAAQRAVQYSFWAGAGLTVAAALAAASMSRPQDRATAFDLAGSAGDS